MGVNLLSMAIVAPLAAAGALALAGAQGASLRRAASAGVAAGVVSVLAAALACAAAVGLSGQSGLANVAPALLVAHLPMALAEGLVTALVLVMARQGVFQSLVTQRAALFAIALLVLVAPLASTLPDSFESAAEELGLASGAALWPAPLEEYAAAGYGWASLAALVGVFAVAGLAATVQTISHRTSLVPVPQRRRVGE
jgi:cobalt/nickel transport system permease protein